MTFALASVPILLLWFNSRKPHCFAHLCVINEWGCVVFQGDLEKAMGNKPVESMDRNINMIRTHLPACSTCP